MKTIDLSKVPTYALCQELEKRAGVEIIEIEPYVKSELQQIEGSAIIFIVKD